MKSKRLLVAVDASDTAARAVDVGIELARSLESELGFVHVVDTAAVLASATVGPEPMVAAEQEARTLLARFHRQAPLATRPVEFIRTGTPAAEILSVAREWQADMIVIGTRGHGSIARMLLGSVAEAVMRQSSCLVLVVPSRPKS